MYISSSSLLAVVGIVSYAAAPIAAQYLENDDYALAIREAFPEFDVDFEDILSLEARGDTDKDASSSSGSSGSLGSSVPNLGFARQLLSGAGSANFPGMRTGRAAVAVGALGLVGKAAGMPLGQRPNPMYDAKRQRELWRSALRTAKPPPVPRAVPTFKPHATFGQNGNLGKRSLDDMLDEDEMW